jgi:O-antigen ligase
VISRSLGKTSFIFWILASFLAIVFCLGGSARADVQSLVILRPVSVIAVGIGLFSLTWEHLRSQKILLVIIMSLIIFTLFQLVPLPESLSKGLQGHKILLEINGLALGERQETPLAISPQMAINVFYSLMIPLAIILLGMQLTLDEQLILLPILILLGLVSGMLGLIQVIGNPYGPMYFYRITNPGEAVGLFANRNHQAVLLSCIFPMLSGYISMPASSTEQSKLKVTASFLIGAALIPLIIVTGSRSGLIVGLLGLILAVAFYFKPISAKVDKRKVSTFNKGYLWVVLGVVTLVAITFFMARAEAFQRFWDADQGEELRWAVWPHIFEFAKAYFPSGGGMGSFVEAYRLHEPKDLLLPLYFNHAHNDLLEFFVESGVFGLLLAVVAVLAFLRGALLLYNWNERNKRSHILGRLAIAITVLLAAASLVDYPVRTPILSALLAVAAIWLQRAAHYAAKSAGALPAASLERVR